MKKFWPFDIQGFLAVAIVVAISGIVFVFCYRPPTLDDKSSAVLTMIIGVLVGALKDVFSYYFGSSKGAAAKDDALLSGDLVAAPAPASPAPTPVAPKPTPPPSGPAGSPPKP